MTEVPTLERILTGLEVEIEPHALSRLGRLSRVLLDYNRHTNLTAIRDPEGVEVKLFADSLALLPLIEAELLREGRETMRLVDIGSGAGFPGLPLAIARQNVQVTMIEATRKKVEFIQHTADLLRIENVIAIHGRSETLAHQAGFREAFDIVTARAVAAFPALAELSLPFLRIGGLGLFPKGRDVATEVADATRALDLLGGELFDQWVPPSGDLDNTIVLNVRKIRHTPADYPRSPGIPVKTPLIGTGPDVS